MYKRIILPLDGFKTGKDLLQNVGELWQSDSLFKEMVGYIKLNDALHMPDVSGPKIITELQTLLPKVIFFLDLKLADIGPTNKNILSHYPSLPNMFVTVRESCSAAGLLELKRTFPKIKLALVSLLTDIDAGACQRLYDGIHPCEKIRRDFVKIQIEYEDLRTNDDPACVFDLVVCSVNEVPFLRSNLPFSISFICPGIRDKWMSDDHQKRVNGIYDAFALNVYPVIGTQLIKGNPKNGISAAESRRLTYEEIQRFFSDQN